MGGHPFFFKEFWQSVICCRKPSRRVEREFCINDLSANCSDVIDCQLRSEDAIHGLNNAFQSFRNIKAWKRNE